MLSATKTLAIPRAEAARLALHQCLADFNQNHHSHFQLSTVTQRSVQHLFVEIDRQEQKQFTEKQEKWQKKRKTQAPGKIITLASVSVFEPYLEPDTGPAYTLNHTFDMVRLIPTDLLSEASFENFFIGALSVAVINIQDRDGVELSNKELAQLLAKSVFDLTAWQKTVLISIRHQIPLQPTVSVEATAIQTDAAFDQHNTAREIEAEPMIHKIVRLNHLDCLKPFVTRDTVNTQDFLGQTALIIASALGFTEMVQCLLAQAAELHWRSSCLSDPKDAVTALDWAYANSHSKIITLLEKAGAPFHQPLDLALQTGHIHSAHHLFNKGFRSQHTYTLLAGQPIHHWIIDNHLVAVQLLTRLNPFLVNQCGADGYSPLLLATHYGHKEIVSWLLKHGAQTTTAIQCPQSRYYQATALDIALFCKYYDIATLLVQCGVRTNYPFNNLKQLIKANALDLVQWLVNASPHLVNQCDEYTHFPLHVAVHGGYHQIVDFLLQHGAHINTIINCARNGYCQTTALDIALIRQHYGIATTLMQYGARTNCVFNNLGQRTLWQLIEIDALDLVKLLIYANPRLVNTSHPRGCFPVQLAAWQGRTKIALCLIDHGAMTRSIGPIKTANEETAKALQQRGVPIHSKAGWLMVGKPPVHFSATLKSIASATPDPIKANSNLQMTPACRK